MGYRICFLRRFCWKGYYGVRVDAAELRIVMGFALAPGPGSCDDDGRVPIGGIICDVGYLPVIS